MNETKHDGEARRPASDLNVERSTSSVERSASVDAAHPWLGLASFTEETRAYFHGRDDDAAELARRVQRKRLTVLFGQSGHGKTSLLRAGLVPRLRQEGYCPVYVRLDYAPDAPPPAAQIKAAIFEATLAAGTWTRAGASSTGESLWEFLHHRDDVLQDAAGRPLIPLLIFDQFEEIFTLAQNDDAGRGRAQAFLAELADLVENRPPVELEHRIERDEADAAKFDFARADYRILISLREDYLAHLEGLKGQMPSVTQNRLRLARFTGAQALAAVRAPAPQLVSEEVATQVVRFVAGGADIARAEVEPSLLSLICRELNNARLVRGQPEITADLLAGSRETILSEFYENSLVDQPAGVRRFIEDELLTDSGYRESVAEERVKKAFAAAGAAPDALAFLVGRRLLRVEERLDVRRVELTHDVLCGVVKASREVRQEREGKEAVERQLAATRAQEEGTRRSLRRARGVAVAAIGLFLLAAGGAAFGYFNMRRAEAAEDRVALERDRAQQSRAEAERLVTFLLDDLYTQLEPTGRIEIVSGLARRALSYFEALPRELRDARSERYRAIAMGRLGAALSQQGKTLEAEDPLREAEELFSRLREGGEPGLEVILGHAAVLRQQSRNAYLQNRWIPAVEIARRGLAVIGPVAGAAGAADAVRIEHARTLMNLGFILMRDRQHTLAMAALEDARVNFRALMTVPGQEQRASVLYAETCAWIYELARFMGRAAEFAALNDEALRIATAAVEREAGHLGALRSRALLRNRGTQNSLDEHDYVTAEKRARETAADWTEFLRFDATNDTALNNRRVSLGLAAEALWRQGRLDAAIEISKENVREIIAMGGSPSTVRGGAFQIARVDNLEAELGRVTDVDTALADGNRMRELGVREVDAESYFRFANPVWGENRRADLLLRMGKPVEALQSAQSVEGKLGKLAPMSGGEKLAHGNLILANLRIQTNACLLLQRWPDAAKAARQLVSGRPSLDDTSVDALDGLATDRALAAVALARMGEAAEARVLLEQAADFNRPRRAAGANDHASRYQSALMALARGLLADGESGRKSAFSAGLAEIAGMPPQPQQLRSVRELRRLLEAELARMQG